MLLRIKFLLAAMLWLAASPAALAQQGAPVKAVASFSIIADLVKQVGGERVDVVSLMGPDADMHGFQPGPGEIRMLRDAKLFVIN